MSNDLEKLISFDDTNINYSQIQDTNFNFEVKPEEPETPTTTEVEEVKQETPPTEETKKEETKVETPSHEFKFETKEEPTPTEEETPEVDPIQAYYDFLVENEVILPNEDFEFEKSSDSLKEAFAQTKHNLKGTVAQELFNALPDEIKPILDYGFKGGTDVQGFLSTYTNAPRDFSNIDLDLKDNQKLVMKEYFRQTSRYTPDKIDRLVDTLDKNGDLETEAFDAILELKDIQKTQKEQLIEQARLQQEARIENENKVREELLSIIDTSDYIPKDRKNKVKGYLFSSSNAQPKIDATLANIFSNKEHVVQLADILIDSYDPKVGFKLEDRYSKKAATKAVDEFQRKLADKLSDSKTKTKSGNTIPNDKPSTGLPYDLLFTDPSMD